MRISLLVLLAAIATTATNATNAISLETAFIRNCVSTFLNERDGIISTQDYASFLANVTGNNSDFTALDITLQLEFVWLMCNDSDSNIERSACLLTLQQTSTTLGYSLNNNENARTDLRSLCSNIYPRISQDLIPIVIDTTMKPNTANPSSLAPMVTVTPTFSPSIAPSVVPVTFAPITAEPPVTTNPTTTSPITSVPTTAVPISATPTTASPIASVPATAVPTSATPTTKLPIASVPTTAAPISATPTTTSPISSVPTTAAPISATPTTTSPIAYVPTTAVPISATPTTTSPISSVPTTGVPLSATPTTASPIVSVPATAAPISATPTTTSPISSVPTTAVPISAAPTTASPISSVPTTAVPLSLTPTTATPVSAMPPVTTTLSPTFAPSISQTASKLPPSTAEPTLVVNQIAGTPTSTSTSKEQLTAGAWAGIGLSGFLFLAGGFYFLSRQGQSFNNSKGPVMDILGDESFSEINSNLGGGGMMKGASSHKSGKSGDSRGSSSKSHGSRASSGKSSGSRGSVSDPSLLKEKTSTSAAAIALHRNDDGESGSTSSGPSFHKPQTDYLLHDEDSMKRSKLNDLDAAIQSADWNEVFKLANSIAGSEDLSSMSGVSSSGRISALAMRSDVESQTSGSDIILARTNSDAQTEARASLLDLLVERGDWASVAETAAGFAIADGTLGSSTSPQRRSFIGFVTGRRTSAAAEAAISSASSVDSSFADSASGRVGAVPLDSDGVQRGINEYTFISLLGREGASTDDTVSETSTGASPAKKSLAGNESLSDAVTIVTGGPRMRSGGAVAEMANAAAATTAIMAAASITHDDPRTAQTEELSAAKNLKGKWGWKSALFRRSKATGYAKMDDSSPSHIPATLKSPRDDISLSDQPLGIMSYKSDQSHLITPTGTPRRQSSDESHVSYLSLRTDLDLAVDRGDWAAVEYLATAVEEEDPDARKLSYYANDNIYPLGAMSRAAVDETDSPSEDSIESLRKEFYGAVDRCQWSVVERLANEILASSPGHCQSPSKYMILSDDQLAPKVTPSDQEIFRNDSTPPSSDAKSCSSSSTTDLNKIRKLKKLVELGNWRGIIALAGVFDMDDRESQSSSTRGGSSTVSPPRPSSQVSSIQLFASEWNTTDGVETIIHTPTRKSEPLDSPRSDFSITAMMGMQARTVSPDHSLSSVSIENHLLHDFEQLVERGDWRGLVEIATRDEGIDTPIDRGDRQSETLGRKDGPPPSSIADDIIEVVLRPVDTPKPKEFRRLENKESIHGAKLLIPFWEEYGPKGDDEEMA